MEQAQKGSKTRTVRSNFHRVISRPGIAIATSTTEIILQLFSEYPDLPDQTEHIEGASPSDPVPTEAIIRELEASIVLDKKSAKELAEALAAVDSTQAA